MKISQREAVSWKKRALAAEGSLYRQRKSWKGDWPDWPVAHVIARQNVSTVTLTAVVTARKLEHAVVCVPQGDDIVFFACEVAK